MFTLNLEGDLCKSASYYDGNHGIKFDPPVYEQRYVSVLRILEHHLWEGKLKKITEFGCAEMKFFQLLKRLKGVEHIMQIDIDEETLSGCYKRTDPLLVDYLKQRETPFRVDVYNGSIATPHELLKNTDAVIGIELIEHLHADVLENVPYTVFGYMKPKVVIFTTPNSEFNVLFQLDLPNGFRHPDHKFEWNRDQFKDWCLNICQRFPNYKVTIFGIGNGPPDKRELGCVSQMCVFVRKDLLDMPLPEDIVTPSLKSPKEDYKLIHSVEYPFNKDERTYDEKLLDDAKYHIRRYTCGDRWLNTESNLYEIPLHIIFSLLFPKVLTMTELSTFLTANEYRIERDTIIVEPEDEEYDGDLNELDFEGDNTFTQESVYVSEDEDNWD